MPEYYYGRVGKDDSYGLASDKQVVLYIGSAGEFRAFHSLAEAYKQVANPIEDHLYYWVNGNWNVVHFLVESGHPEPALGFKSQQNPN